MIQVPSSWACARHPCAVVQWTTRTSVPNPQRPSPTSYHHHHNGNDDKNDNHHTIHTNNSETHRIPGGEIDQQQVVVTTEGNNNNNNNKDGYSYRVVSKWFLCRVIPSSSSRVTRRCYDLQTSISLGEAVMHVGGKSGLREDGREGEGEDGREDDDGLSHPPPHTTTTTTTNNNNSHSNSNHMRSTLDGVVSAASPPPPIIVQRLISQDCAPAEHHWVYRVPKRTTSGSLGHSICGTEEAGVCQLYTYIPAVEKHPAAIHSCTGTVLEKGVEVQMEQEVAVALEELVLYCPRVLYSAKAVTLIGPRHHARSTPAHLAAALTGQFLVAGATFTIAASLTGSSSSFSSSSSTVLYEVAQLDMKPSGGATGSSSSTVVVSAVRGVIGMVGANCRVRLNDRMMAPPRGAVSPLPPSPSQQQRDRFTRTTSASSRNASSSSIVHDSAPEHHRDPLPYGLARPIQTLQSFLWQAAQWPLCIGSPASPAFPSARQGCQGGQLRSAAVAAAAAAPKKTMGAFNGILIRGPHGCGITTLTRYTLSHPIPPHHNATTTTTNASRTMPPAGRPALSSAVAPPSTSTSSPLTAVQVVQWAPGQVSMPYVLEHVVPKARLLVLLIENVAEHFPAQEPELAKLSLRMLQADMETLLGGGAGGMAVHEALRVTVVGVAHQYGSLCATSVLDSFFIHPHIVMQLPNVDQRAALLRCARGCQRILPQHHVPRRNNSIGYPSDEGTTAQGYSRLTDTHKDGRGEYVDADSEEEEDEELLRLALELVGKTRREVIDYGVTFFTSEQQRRQVEVHNNNNNNKNNNETRGPCPRPRPRRSARRHHVMTWDDIGGLEEVKRELQQSLVMPQRHRKAFARFHLSPPSGVLLYGPPGCAKTTLVKALCAEGIFSLLYLDSATVMSAYVGESERMLRDTFHQAAQQAPCIVFFDEVEVLGGAREGGGGGGGERDARLLSTVLTEMDGFAANAAGRGVCFVGATNVPHLIDAALLRPGRMDRVLYVPLPTAADRVAILSLYLGQSTAADVEAVAQATEGFSGADLQSFCANALLTLLTDGARWRGAAAVVENKEKEEASAEPFMERQSEEDGAGVHNEPRSSTCSSRVSPTATLLPSLTDKKAITTFLLEQAKQFPRTKYDMKALETFRRQILERKG